MRELVERVAVVLTSAILALVAGYFWVAGSFANLGPGETRLERVALVLGFEVRGAIVIGILLVRFWYFSVIAAWAPTISVIVWLTRPSAVEFQNIVLASITWSRSCAGGGVLGRLRQAKTMVNTAAARPSLTSRPSACNQHFIGQLARVAALSNNWFSTASASNRY